MGPSPASVDPSTPRYFAIVPAAGRSARMGAPKLLLPWKHGTLIEQVLAAWRASRVAKTFVVVHPADVTLADVCRRAGAEVVVPDDPPPDMKASVRHALAWIAAQHAPQESDAWLLAPADMPRLSAALIDTVVAAHDPAAPRVVLAASGGRRGHPVLFPWALAAEVPRLGPHEGLNALVGRNTVVEISWSDDSPLLDIDNPEDYRRLRT